MEQQPTQILILGYAIPLLTLSLSPSLFATRVLPIAVKIVSFVELLFIRILFSFFLFFYQFFFYKNFCLELHKQIKRNAQVVEVQKRFPFLFFASSTH